ncbi:TetR/AcrR family transcriptional regulator [Butyrivibrio sp. CB08]|uniref:TetR/AcrR family transcriptional regulator n=1 Tax=Butyrivibrio sp. CB08 TaxID=2364879 RepID=UPI000EA943A6|nr:TetR/AcrR family transcriptional regulator [Butyrivibrio sp. CB08]RKM61252.1 TetR/AcrR family transcriptional regulator [Butyrivibrio sp. CB08]
MRIVKTAEERKNEILDVAEELFAEKGYDNASTNDIIARIGIARGTLYHHFGSKEEILDAIIDRMTRQAIAGAKAIVNDKDMPVLEKVAKALLAINIQNGAKDAVLEQMHKPQNALLHQKMQEKLISGVVPLFAQLIEEGNKQGLFDARYPQEASEMIMIYSNVAFDELENLTPKQMKAKGKAFIHHTERILGAKEGSLVKVLGPFFG